MLPKRERFSTEDFKSIKKQKTKKFIVNNGFFVVLLGLSNTKLESKFIITKKSVILPKKIFKTAVLRNKYKRLYYNTISFFLKEKNLDKSFIYYPRKTFTKENLLEDLSILCK